MPIPELQSLVPHSGRMLLLDRVTQIGDVEFTAEVTIRADSQFFDGRGVGAWVGLEYMAQAAAAFAGHQATLKGERATPGLLLGTRRYTCNVPMFPLGAALRVTVHRESRSDTGLASFIGRIEGDGIVADAVIAVYHPENAEDLLRVSDQ